MTKQTPMKYLAILCSLVLSAQLPAQTDPENSRQIADRYEQMLLRSPQPGTAFDKVVEWYSTHGGLESLRDRWEKTSLENPQYLLLGALLAEHLRTPDKARRLYLLAMEKGNDPATAARLLAALETTEGHFPAAVEACKKALSNDTLPPVDRMELMRSLALLYRRSFEDGKAAEVWKDALARFPDDPSVLEEAGEAFLDAGDYPSARSAFTRLQEVSRRDPFRKVTATLRLARAVELAGETGEAVKIYELALEETSAGSWINREVRSRIEELFRRKDDLPGLLAYYERRTTAVPQDYLALAAQAEVLNDLARGEEALPRLRAASQLAPDDLQLRLQLIRQLEILGNLQEAVSEARELAKPSDSPTEVLLCLGQLLWNDYTKTNRPETREEAMATWRRMAPADSTDPSRIAQLAEILASRGEIDAAVEEWKRLVSLTPAAADARQKLAQIFLQRGDKNSAGEILAGLVAGDLAKPENFLTLARIQTRLDWPEETRSTLQTALARFPSDGELLNFAWKQALETNSRKEADSLLPDVWKAAPNDFFAEDVLKRQVSFLESSGSDKETLDRLAAQEDLDELQASLLLRLALSRRDSGTADKALQKLQSLTSAIRLARARADYARTFGTPEEQVAALRAVAETDPRMAAESLKSSAQILADSGKTDEALATILQLLDRSPADASLYSLSADIAARSGRFDVACERLREGVRHAGDAGALRLQLATFLQAQSRNTEAAKVLQEAFESEEREGRRSEIFRRQIELALQTGTQEELISTLRAKQSREQGGARYGACLAEIFLMQGDFVAAREELEKSLGHNPDNPQAVAKLIDLADRGGDQEEGLRLSARLAALEPSRENRANHIARLFNAGEFTRGREEMDKVRSEILKDPTDWNPALIALKKAGGSQEADALIEEIAASKPTDVFMLSELAKLRLSQLDTASAKEALWRILETDGFEEAVAAITQAAPLPPSPVNSPFWARLQPLQQLSSEVQNSLQMLFQPSRSGFFSRSFYMGTPSSQQVTQEQRAMLRAVFLLQHLSRAEGQEKEFAGKMAALLEKKNLSPTAKFLLLTSINDQDGLRKLIADQAAQEHPDLETDRLLLRGPLPPLPESQADLDKIRARLEKADPVFSFQEAVSKLQTDTMKNNPSDESQKTAVLSGIRLLLEHPGMEKNPLARLQLAALAANNGDLELATSLCEAAKNSEEWKKSPPQAGSLPAQQLDATAALLMTKGILANDKRINATFERLLQDFVNSPSPAGGSPVFFYYGAGRGAPNLLAQESPELAMGDSDFPVPVFRRLFPMNFPSSDGDKITAWFAKHTTSGKLDPYVLGLAYCEWFSGKKEEAVKRIETLHAANPTPRTAALLLEFHEKCRASEKALAVIDLASLQKSETPDVRALRKIRLLRATGKTAEAKDLAEKLARGRVSTNVRDFLRNELSQLGVPMNQYPALAGNSISRSSNDRSTQLRNQISKLLAEQKSEEATRMALQLLQNPLPSSPDDYQTVNIRRLMLETLRSLKQLDKLEEGLEARLATDPGDFDAAVRLLEIASTGGDRKFSPDRLQTILSQYPDRGTNVGYAFQLLQQRSDTKEATGALLCSLIRSNPDLLHKSGFQLERLTEIISDPQTGLELAEIVTAMDDKAFSRLFLPARLSQRMGESAFLGQLAETCVQAGKKEAAITLLKRIPRTTSSSFDGGLLSTMRLAELQLQINDKEGASATMKDLFTLPAENRPGGIYGSPQTISAILMNMLMNRGPGQSASDQIGRLAKIARETDTQDLLLKALDDQSAKSASLITPALLLKTALGRPGIAEQWREIVLNESTPLGFVNLQMLSPVLKELASQKDAAKLIPALLRRIPGQQFGMGGDASLAALAETLPTLARFCKDPVVKKHIALLVSSAMRDPNAAQYLTHYEAYPRAISALIDQGFFPEARSLLDFTKAARTGRRHGNESLFESFEARLAAASGQKTDFQIVCAAGNQKNGKTPVFWKVTPGPVAISDEPHQPGTIWDAGILPIPDKQRPQSLELFAGPNPGNLRPVAKVTKPELAGSLSATLPDRYGLLQMRWTLPDGTTQSGGLTVYVQGSNLISSTGLPDAAASQSGFQAGQPGPLGEKSAVKFDALLPRMEQKVALGEASLDGSPEILVLTGWVQTSQSNGRPPQVGFELLLDNGTKEPNAIYLPQTSPGCWCQFVKLLSMETPLPGASSLPKETRKIGLSLNLHASTGYNYQWQVSGAWDGIGLFRFPPEKSRETVEDLVARARKSLSAKDCATAAADLLTALPLNPRKVLEQTSSTLFPTFEKAGRLSELYSFLSQPSLYLPDPFNSNSPTVNNRDLIASLVRGALSEDAPPAAKAWLRQVANMHLNENTRFLIESAILREEAKKEASGITPEKILALLGFSTPPNQERLRRLWSSSSSPAFDLLSLLNTPEKITAAREALSKVTVPASLLSAEKTIEAWLLAPTDPSTALKLWTESVALRNSGENTVSFNTDSDKILFLRIAATHSSPGDIVAAIKNWTVGNRSNPEYQQRQLVETLYALANTPSPHKAFYETAWADAELAALRLPNYNASRERIRELAGRMMNAAEWDRLSSLLAQAQTNPALNSSSLQREFAQLRDLAAFARGDCSKAWPVVWCTPGTNSRRVKVSWQWNMKDIQPAAGKFDTAISVSAKALLPEIPEQTAIEFLFGEIPSSLSVIAKAEGNASEGSTDLELPSGNGFLRGVALVGGKRIPGPLVPVLSGRRLFPDVSLKSFLQGGPRPLDTNLLADSGTAPDGSPAVRIGPAGSRDRREFEGPAIPVEAGKFYVMRAWLRRSGEGSASVSGEFRPAASSKAGSLNMILSERDETTSQWVLYTRALPVIPQHTFWIPFREVATLVPRIWDMASGSELAGWELLEIENWSYGKWLTETALLRESSGETPDQALLDKMCELAAFEPLTAIDYHGDWLVANLAGTGHPEKLLPLYQAALNAEANPFFSRPKLWRIFGSLLTLADKPEIPEPVRWEALELALANKDRMDPSRRFAFQRRHFLLAKDRGLGQQARDEITSELFRQLAEKNKARDGHFLSEILTNRTYRDDRPVNECFALLDALADDATFRKLLTEINGDSGKAILPHDRAFVELAFGLCLAAPSPDLNDRVDKAFQATEKSTDPAAYMYWPSLLGDLMVAKKCDPGNILHLRQKAIERLLSTDKGDSRQEELLRAAAALAEFCASTGNPAPLREGMPRILDDLSSRKQNRSPAQLRMALRILDALSALEEKDSALTLLKLVEPDVRKSSKTLASYSKYLPETPPSN